MSVTESEELKLDELAMWPDGLCDVPAVLIQQVLPRPTLIHLPGLAAEPIFVSVLLHGDEAWVTLETAHALACEAGDQVRLVRFEGCAGGGFA